MNTSASAPRLARLEAIEEGAASFFAFARTTGVRFELTRKVADAVDYSAEAGGSTFALPTKLQGTSNHQPTLAALGAIPHRYRKLIAAFVPDTRAGRTGAFRVALYFGGDRLGFVQDKHLPWLSALVPSRDFLGTGVLFYALQVTGGEPGRPTRGLNVLITGAGERAALMLDRTEADRLDAEAAAEAERHAALPDF